MASYRVNGQRACGFGHNAEGLGLGTRIVACSCDGHCGRTHIRVITVSGCIVCAKREGGTAILHYYRWGNCRARVGLASNRVNGQRACSLGNNGKSLRLGARIVACSCDRHRGRADIDVVRVGGYRVVRR